MLSSSLYRRLSNGMEDVIKALTLSGIGGL